MDVLRQDLRHAVRALAATPGFTTVVVLTLALGIGATSSVFSVVRHVLLRPLPYAAPERIVQVWNPWSNEPGVTRGRSALAGPDYADARRTVRSFDHVAAYAPQEGMNLTGHDLPERVAVVRATAGLFNVLGVQPSLGRGFTEEEDAPGRADVVVISHGLWERRFAGAADVTGRIIRLDGVAHRVIGVMPQSFSMPADLLTGVSTDVWKPLGLDADRLDRGNHWLHVLARLAHGASLAGANAELASLTRWWIDQGFKIHDLPPYYAVTIEEELFGSVRPALFALTGAVVFVLLIACANVANLLLARADARRAEIALRSALGAGRLRIVRQVLTQSIVLAVAGGACGLLIAYVGVQALVAFGPVSVPRVEQTRIDAAVLGFTALVALGTAIVFGLAPALHSMRPALSRGLTARGLTAGAGRARLQGLLTSAEVTLAVVLVTGAALMIRTFAELARVELGFDAASVLTFSLTLPTARYDEAEDRVRVQTRLVGELERLPGVHAAGGVHLLPLTGRLGGGSVLVEGAAPPAPGEGLPNARWQVATPGYFRALRHTLEEGRWLTAEDRAGAVPVVLVNRTLADMFWPGRSALGRRLRNTNDGVPWFTVVGVVRDVHHSGVVDEPSPTIYFPLEQMPLTRSFTPASMAFALRTSGDPLRLASAARSAVAALDADLPLADVRTMEAIVDDALARPRFIMVLLGLFASVALALALVGIYGLLSYTVSRQRREMGIRVALGASRGSVLMLVVSRGMRLTLLGLAPGLAAAALLARLLDTLLYGVAPLDPVTFIVVPVLFALATLAATGLPAVRASGADPMLALKED